MSTRRGTIRNSKRRPIYRDAAACPRRAACDTSRPCHKSGAARLDTFSYAEKKPLHGGFSGFRIFADRTFTRVFRAFVQEHSDSSNQGDNATMAAWISLHQGPAGFLIHNACRRCLSIPLFPSSASPPPQCRHDARSSPHPIKKTPHSAETRNGDALDGARLETSIRRHTWQKMHRPMPIGKPI